MFLRRFVSLEALKVACSRFPLSILSATLATGLSMWMSWHGWNGYNSAPSWIEPLFASSFIGILLFTGLALFSEGLRLRSWLVQAIVGIPVLYFLAYRVTPDLYDTQPIHYALLFFASLALIFGGYYTRSTSSLGQWNFGIKTWTKACIAISSALILMAGFNLALLSVERLFEVSFQSPWYAYVAIFFGIFVANLIFVSGIPYNMKSLEKTPIQEKSLRIFALFLSFPLLLTYFLILSAYIVKILITQDWPNGFVAMPVLLFSLLGFGTYALAFPLRERAEGALAWFYRSFPWAVLPFLIVYFVALWKRIEPYGLTEMRMLGLLLGLLLAFWALYFGLRKKKAELRVIPLSFFVVSFVFSFGPWSVFSLSEWHQVSRLETLLTEKGILVDGQFQSVLIDLETNADASEIVAYLESHHGFGALQAWFDFPIEHLTASELMEKMGMQYSWSDPWVMELDHYYFNSDPTTAFSLEGYDYSFSYYEGADWSWEEEMDAAYLPPTPQSFSLGSETVTVQSNYETVSIDLGYKNQTLSLELLPLLARLKEDFDPNAMSTTPQALQVSAENADLAVKIYFNNVDFAYDDEGLKSLFFDSQILVTLKK